MAARSIISYDDITSPYRPSESAQAQGRPPQKKRRKSNKRSKNVHHNLPMRKLPTTTLENQVVGMEEEGEFEDESRELSHGEIWDDSSLVEAWEAAQQEYEIHHGSNKDWKTEPVKKSPLWYNIPVDPVSKKTNGVQPNSGPLGAETSPSSATKDQDMELDSRPLNFETFVPTHDPSLATDPAPNTNYVAESEEGHMVTQDEAFSRAVSAMYWGGYWTAMYQCQRSFHRGAEANSMNSVQPDKSGDEDDNDEDQDDFVSTQR